MPAVWRLRGRASFQVLQRRGRRSRVGPLTLTFLDDGVAGPPRVGYSVGRHVGTAVVRNRVRRRLRASIAELAPRLAPGAYLVGVGPAAADLSQGEMTTMLSSVLPAPTGAAASSSAGAR